MHGPLYLTGPQIKTLHEMEDDLIIREARQDGRIGVLTSSADEGPKPSLTWIAPDGTVVSSPVAVSITAESEEDGQRVAHVIADAVSSAGADVQVRVERAA